MPFKTFVNGAVLPASDMNTYLMGQAVTIWDDATARDAAITAPTEGQVAYLKLNDVLTYHNGTSWRTYATGANIAYTPTLANLTNTGTGAVTTGYYSRFGDIVVCHVYIVLGSTFSISGGIQISLPVAQASTSRVTAYGRGNPASTSYTLTGIIATGTNNIQLYANGSAGAYVTNNLTSSLIPNTWAAGNSILMQIIYEV